jgi:NADH-quinone oxidoreductase subunit J
MLEWAAFVVFGLTLLLAGRNVVVSRDLVHSVLWLGLALVATAGLFVTLQAEFLAAVQILLYTGGVITLMLFGVMLTRRLSGVRIEHGSSQRVRGAVLAIAAFALVAFAATQAPRSGAGSGIRSAAASASDTAGASDGTAAAAAAAGTGFGDPQALGSLILRDLMLPFEILSILLLAAMIGAIVLARKVDP